MNPTTITQSNEPPGRNHAALATVVFGSLGWLLMRKPISQDPEYHEFVDRRRFFGIPNFNDVSSNLPFLLVGASGTRFCLRDASVGIRAPWSAFFAGVGLTGAGSAYYHWRPTNETLAWDRLPMSIAFMGLFTALTGERLGRRPVPCCSVRRCWPARARWSTGDGRATCGPTSWCNLFPC